MNLREAPNRMHDPKSYPASHFLQEKDRIYYAHEDEPTDSIYRESIDFQEVLSRIVDPHVKAHILKYQKDMKICVIHFRKVRLTVQENMQWKNLEKDAKENSTSSSSALASKSKDNGNSVLESFARNQRSLMIVTLHKL